MRTSYAESHPVVFFPNDSEACVSSGYLSCWSMKLEIMYKVTFWEKKKKKKKGCANIIVAAWVNFCTSTCIYLHEPLPYWLVLLYDYINQVKSCLKFVLFVNCQVLIGQVLLALHDDLHHFKIWFHLIFMVPQLCFPSDSRYLSLLSSDVCALHLSPAFSELHLNFQAG